jgi:2-polyprenyl-6-methoxyphenol hydroxylase-like FAD-dependent oxidoreductase
LDFTERWQNTPHEIEETPMDVLISGAGVAGLMTACWLRRYGFNPTIVERTDALVVGGYKIDVRGTALEVLQRTEIHEDVVSASTHMQGAMLVDREGNVIGTSAAMNSDIGSVRISRSCGGRYARF